MKNNSKGLNLCLIGALVSLIALIVYFFVMYRLPVVFVLLIAAIAFGAVAAVAGEKLGKWIGLLPWCNALFNAGALVAAVYLMVNQIGYVIAELDTIDTILAFIIFEIVALGAVIINIVASFLPVDNVGTVKVEVETKE